MPKVFENDVIFDYDPIHTLNHIHRKYPNPFSPHVYTVDTISRTVDPETGIIRSERLLGVQQGAPGWIRKLFQLPETAYVREVVFIEPAAVKATYMSMNLSLSEYVSCLELITYSPEPPVAPTAAGTLEPGMIGLGASATASLFHQRALITGFTTGTVGKMLEKTSVATFGKNAGAGKKGFEWVLAGGKDKGAK